MPKILWMSPYSLHDISSGASIHCRIILEGLAKRGCTVWSFSSFVFDRPNGADHVFGPLDQFYAKHQNARFFEFDDRNIHYVYLKSEHTFEFQRTSQEQMEFFNAYCEVLERFQPDMVIGYGTGMDSYTCFAHAQRLGIITAYLVLNGKHAHFSFPHLDLVLTDSKTTANLYASREHINCIPIGQFINPETIVAKEHYGEYVTMVNPDLSKGLAIFAKLALVAQKKLPHVKFLAINSRSVFSQEVQKLHEQGQQEKLNAKMFPNVFEADATHDMRLVYEKTKVMTAFSLAYESWGRIASEALLNGIPVLANNVGGIAEAVQNGGIVLNPPAHCLEDFTQLPTDEEIAPYVEALERLLTEDFSQATKEAAQNVNYDQLLNNLVQTLNLYFERRLALLQARAQMQGSKQA